MSATVIRCWREIGVHGGDQSCPRLDEVLHCRNCEVFRAAALTLLDRESPEVDAGNGMDADAGVADETSMLVFRLGAQWLGLPPARVAEVAPDEPVRRLAHRTDGRLEGVVNVRGELHLCVALVELLALGERTEQATATARLVLTDDASGRLLAFRSDEVLGLVRYRRQALEPAPSTLPPTLARCVAGLVSSEQRHVALLEPDALMRELEKALFE